MKEKTVHIRPKDALLAAGSGVAVGLMFEGDLLMKALAVTAALLSIRYGGGTAEIAVKLEKLKRVAKRKGMLAK